MFKRTLWYIWLKIKERFVDGLLLGIGVVILSWIIITLFLGPLLTPHTDIRADCESKKGININAFNFGIKNRAGFSGEDFNLIIHNAQLLDYVIVAAEGYFPRNSSQPVLIYRDKTASYKFSKKWIEDYCSVSNEVINKSTRSPVQAANGSVYFLQGKSYQIHVHCSPIPPKTKINLLFNTNQPYNNFNISYWGKNTPFREEIVYCPKATCYGYVGDRIINLWYFLINRPAPEFCPKENGFALFGYYPSNSMGYISLRHENTVRIVIWTILLVLIAIILFLMVMGAKKAYKMCFGKWLDIRELEAAARKRGYKTYKRPKKAVNEEKVAEKKELSERQKRRLIKEITIKPKERYAKEHKAGIAKELTMKKG